MNTFIDAAEHAPANIYNLRYFNKFFKKPNQKRKFASRPSNTGQFTTCWTTWKYTIIYPFLTTNEC